MAFLCSQLYWYKCLLTSLERTSTAWRGNGYTIASWHNQIMSLNYSIARGRYSSIPGPIIYPVMSVLCHGCSLQWRHNGCDGVSNHQFHHCLLNRLLRRRSRKASKLRVTGLCAGNSPVTGEFPAQMTSYTKNVSVWWHHHGNSDCVRLHVFAWVCERTWVLISVKYMPIRIAMNGLWAKGTKMHYVTHV